MYEYVIIQEFHSQVDYMVTLLKTMHYGNAHKSS